MDHNLEIICVEPPHDLNVYQVSAQSDVNCRRSYTETKTFTDGRTDAEGYNIIRPFFKRAYNKNARILQRFFPQIILKRMWTEAHVYMRRHQGPKVKHFDVSNLIYHKFSHGAINVMIEYDISASVRLSVHLLSRCTMSWCPMDNLSTF